MMYGASASWVRITSTVSATRTPPKITACQVGGSSTRLGERGAAAGADASGGGSTNWTSEAGSARP